MIESQSLFTGGSGEDVLVSLKYFMVCLNLDQNIDLTFQFKIPLSGPTHDLPCITKAGYTSQELSR